MSLDAKFHFQARARAEGLVLLGIVSPDYPVAGQRYREWIKSGMHAEMFYLEKNSSVRGDPRSLLAGVQSVLIFGLPYAFDGEDDTKPCAAQYACHPDYHKIMRGKLNRVWAGSQFFEVGQAFRIFVDSAPLLEKALAEKTERGFIGKNTCYIHPEMGSFLLLGEILTVAELRSDRPSSINPEKRTGDGGCGICTACQVSCPTGALDESYRIDSRKCLAYWTIENRGPIPIEFWPHLREYWFGCDICQNVCPFNTHAEKSGGSREFPVRAVPDIFTVAMMGESEYVRYFSGTPFTRAKRGGLRRNALIALLVTDHPRVQEAVDQVRIDPLYPLCETVEQISQYRFEFRSQTCVNIPHATNDGLST